MLLSESERGVYTVHGVFLPSRIRRRLISLGIVYRSELTVLRAGRYAAVIRCRGAKYALGGRIARGITVDPVR